MRSDGEECAPLERATVVSPSGKRGDTEKALKACQEASTGDE
jgi:hypothetical protein